MSNRNGINPNVLNLLSSLDAPVGTSYRDQWRQRQEELAAEAEALANPPQPQDDGFFQRSAGEVAGDLGSGLAKGVNSVGGAIVQNVDAGVELQKNFSPLMAVMKHYFPERVAESEKLYTNVAEGVGNFFKSGEDYWQDNKSDKIKADAAYASGGEGFTDTVGRVLERPQVIPDLVADSAAYMLPGGWAARAIAATGASKGAVVAGSMGVGAALDAGATGMQAKREVLNMTPEQLMERSPDYKVLIDSGISPQEAKLALARDAGFTAQAIQLPISFLASKLTGAGKIESDFFTGQGVKNFFSAIARETAEEGIQESSAQVATNIGVQQNADETRSLTQDVGKNAALGMIAGGAQASGMKALGALVPGQRGTVPDANDDGIDVPVDGPLSSTSNDPLQLQHNPQRMITMTDGTTAWESELADLNTDQAAKQHPAYASPIVSTGDQSNPDDRFKFELNTESLRSRIQNARAKRREEMNRVNRTVDFAPVEIPTAPAAALQNIDAIEFAPPALPESSRFSLAPLEQSNYENGVDFTPQGAKPSPDRVNDLAAGVEQAISKNIDSARSARMPENLKDTRLLRNRYRTHLTNVAESLDSNAGAFSSPDSLLDMAAKNGGLNAAAWAKEGIDPADAKLVNNASYAKAFRQNGGMTPDDLAEFAAQRGFSSFANAQGAPDANAALNAINEELAGKKRYSAEDETALQAAQSAPAYISELKEFGSPEAIKRAITLALEGKNLGENQLRIVQEVLNNTNTHSRDDKTIKEKWADRAKTMLANRGNKELNSWRNRDEHAADATTHEAALNEIMTDAIENYGIDPDAVKNAYRTYAEKYPAQGQLTAAMTSWVSANKPNTSEHLSYEQQNRKAELSGRSSSQRGAALPGAGLSLESEVRQEASKSRGDAPSAQAESGGDSAGRDAGLRQPVDSGADENQLPPLAEGFEKSLLRARPLAKKLGIPNYNQMRLAELVPAINAVYEAQRSVPKKPKPIEGKNIDGDWAEFSDDSGSLKIPRAEMPQIKAEHRGAMVNFLNARGVEHQEENVPADSLKPTQAEFSREKVAKAKGFEGGNRSILISSDNHVLDGHHQWMAARDNGEDVKVIRLDAPIKKLVDLAHEFPSSTTEGGISVEDAAKLTADLKRLSRTPEFETDGSRYPAFAKRIEKAIAGDADAVKWANEWLADIDKKQESAQLESKSQAKADSEKAQEKDSADADKKSKKLESFARGEIPEGVQPKYAEWVKSLSDSRRRELFSSDVNDGVRNVEYMAWVSGADKNKYKRPESEVQYQSELQSRLRNGDVSITEFKAAFSALTNDRERMTAELSSLTKDKLIDLISGYSAVRAKSEKKDYAVRAAYESLITQYYYAASNSGMFSYSHGSKDYIQGKIEAVKPFVDDATQENLDAYAKEYADAIKEREENKKRKTEGMQDPKTLEDFRNLHRSILNENENMTQADARMQMSAEQRAEYDRLSAIETRVKRIGDKAERKTAVSSGDQLVGGTIIETKHTKKGHDLFVVQLEARVSKDDYTTLAASAKRLGGYYSSFRGAGAIPGFQFTTSDDAKAFLDLAGGNDEAASQIAKEKRDAFEDDKSQSTAERLRTMAAAMNEHAESELTRDRKSNTSRRAGMAARALESAEREKAMAETMARLADGIESGELTFLDKLRTKAQLSQIQAAMHVAKGDEIRKKYDSYAEQLKHEGEPITAETVDHASWPYYVAYRSDLAKLARQMVETDGLKKLGNDLLKVADDTSAEYMEFAKENLHKVSTFQNKDGGLAVFKTKKAAALSIEGSGFSGKAIPFEVKRGENLIILSSSEAAARGIWSGSDKKITLAPDFVEKLIEQAAKKNRKKENVSVPWQLETAYEKRQRYKSMGIETAAEFRAALREYVGIAKQPSEMDKVKKLELAMVGRKKDGLDFFPTPQSVADEMINTAGIQAGMSVLEPSAGMGHIADRIRAFGVEPDVVEISSERRELLEAKGYNLAGNDFTEYKNRETFGYGDTFRAEDGSEGILRGQGGLGSDRVRLVDENGEGVGKKFFSMDELTPVKKNGAGAGYDRIIMNPPFSDRRDMEHVLHAYDLLKPGGRIVAIVGEGVMFGSDKKATEFRDWLDKLGATAEKLEEGTFNDPSLPVTTGVNARMLVIDKPESGDIKYKFDGKATKSISRESAQAVIDRISKDWKVKVKINLIGSIDELPDSVKSRLHKADDEQGEPAALIDESTGHVYINLSKAASERSIEELIFHEVYTHFGLRQLMGAKVSGLMTRLYLNLGKSQFDAMAKKYGVNTEAYREAYKEKPEEYVQAILSEELLAHMAEHPRPAIVRIAQEFVGAVRAWLRESGFMELASISETDMRYLLKQSRETVTKGKQGNITGLIYSLAGISKADRKAINAERNRAAVDEPQDSERNVNEDLITMWATISRDEESFQLPFSRKKDFVEIAQELEGYNGFKSYEADELALMNKHKAENAWRVVTPKGEKAAVFQKGDKVWIDVSDLESGEGGRRIYNMVANYAYNNKKVFMGDPAGLSITAKSRRLENMISSALKFGTTDHLQPHRLQLVTSHGVPGLTWKKGDTENNILEMIRASYESVKNQFPEIESMVYNPEEDQFQYRDSGKEVTKDGLNNLAAAARAFDGGSDSSMGNESGGSSASGKITAGRRTIERAILTGSILRGTRSEASRLLDKLSEQRSERLTGDNAILYSLPNITRNIPFVRDRILRNGQSRSLPPTMQESYDRLGDKTLVEKLKSQIKRQLTPAGLLPQPVFDLKIARDGEMNAVDMATRHTLRGFYDAVEKAYGMEYQFLKTGTKREINKVLRGDQNVQLAPSVVQALTAMRDDIKRLSALHLRQLVADASALRAEGKDAEADSKQRLIETISDNFDTYLNRSYRAFDDKNWPSKVPAKVYQDAVEFLAGEYANGGTVTPDILAKAKTRVAAILTEGTAFESMGAFISEGKLGSKDLSIMKKRKDVPAPIRALLGEYEDAAVNYAKSVTKMSRLVHNHAFLTSMKQAAFDLGLISETQGEGMTKIAADASEAYAPLNGLYTTRDFKQALVDVMGKHNPNVVYDSIVAVNGMVKMGKTVLAPTTAMRNFMSSLFFTFANGHFDYSHAAQSVRVMQVYFKDRGPQGVKDYMLKMRKLGVIYDSPYASEMMDLLKDSQLADWVERKESWLAKNAGKALDFSQRFYSMGDDFYKIIGFENEKALLIKHRGLSEAEAEKEAAERIRNTYPTYSMIGKGINTLRRFPLVGSFVSFPAEIIRTSYHITRYLKDDIQQYGIKDPIVMRKVVGYALAAGLISAMSMLSASLAGVGDDEEAAVRAMAPNWSKNSTFLWLGKDDKGNRQYIDLSFLDPYGYWKRPITAALNNDSLSEAAVSGAKDLLSPFLSWDIAAKAIGEAAFNGKVDGGPVYNESDSAKGVALDISNHLRKALQPGFVTNIEKFILAGMGEKSKTGKEYKTSEELAALMGWRVATFDPKIALYYQSFEYQDNKSNAAKILSRVASSTNAVSDEELRTAYEQSMKARAKAFDDMSKIVSAAKSSGMSDQELKIALRNSGVSILDARALVANKPPVFAPSKTAMKGAIKKASVLFDEETQREFKKREKYLNELRLKSGSAHLSDSE